MFLHLGQSTVVLSDDIIGIFDIDKTTVSQRTRDFLSSAEKENRIVNVSSELPASFVVMKDRTVYISQISVSTLINRTAI